jgi:hypothetical protein
VRSVDAVSAYFLEFKRKFGKYFTGQDVKGDRIPAKDGIYDLPDPAFFKPSIDVFSIHALLTRLPDGGQVS